MILEVSNVSKTFGGLQALKDVNVTVEEGHIMGLIGPNGAGKTTLFNVINGVYKPDTGKVIFRGKDIVGSRPHRVARSGLARTHQIVRPLNDMTVRDNVIVGACFGRHNLSLGQAAKVADEVLEFVGLASRAKQFASSLNVGQKKRLEMARALAAQPYLLLLDEVLAGLNPTEISAMIKMVLQIRDRGITIIMIEHVMQAIMQVSDQMLVLDFGTPIAYGTPSEVSNDPKVIEAYLGDPKLATELMESMASDNNNKQE